MRGSENLNNLTPQEERAVLAMIREAEDDFRANPRIAYDSSVGLVDPEFTPRVKKEAGRRLETGRYAVTWLANGVDFIAKLRGT
jgi:hypothetical protein